MESCYKGGRDWFTPDNIFQYVKEGENEYASRIKRAYRFNHTREVVDLVNKYIFRATIQRSEDAPQDIQEFWKYATKGGKDITYFMQEASKESSKFGRVYAIVDSPKSDNIESELDRKEAQIRPYVYLIQPQDALDMSFDEMGKLNWFLMRQIERDDENPLEEQTDPYYVYILWDRQNWYRFAEEKKEGSEEPTVVLQEEGSHGLGVVPVVPIDHIEDESLYTSPSLINDIAYLDRAVANYLSNLDQIIQDQTFSQLTLPAQGFMPGDEDKPESKLKEMGTSRIFTYNSESGGKPEYISPDPKQAELLIKAIRAIINEIYHTIGMAGERTKQDNAVGIDNSSGVAKAYDFERVNALLVHKAKMLSKAENQITEIVSLWLTGDTLEPEEPYVDYGKSFDINSVVEDFEEAINLATIEGPEELRRSQMKRLAQKMLRDATQEEMQRVLSDIEDNWPLEQPVNMAFGGEVVGGPSEQGSVTSDTETESEAG